MSEVAASVDPAPTELRAVGQEYLRAMRDGDSVFTPGRAIWARPNAEELVRVFVDRPDISGRSFTEKLDDQLADASDEALQLFAELWYASLAPLADYAPETKRSLVTGILAKMSAPVELPDVVVAALSAKAFNGGVAFKTRRPFQLMLLVRMLTQQAIEDEASLRWFEEQASIRNSLTRELNHRVKNTLANVLSILALTRRRATSLEEFAASLDGRIRALSATHDLLTQSDWGTTPIRSVIEAELLPYAHASDHRIELQGPHIELAPNDALSLGLATHELATNAAKYGSLSRPGGKVAVHWKLISEALVRVEWQESGGPPVPARRGRGFGTDLIERIVAHELKHEVQLDFLPEGVRCVLTIPVRQPTQFAMRATGRTPPTAS